MRCLVTGGSGFVGSTLVRALRTLGHDVVVTGRSGEQRVGRFISYQFHNLNWSSLGHFDALFHQAAVTNTTHPRPQDFYFVNYHYSQALFADAARHGCRQIVYASSCAVYGNCSPPFREAVTAPLNAYGMSKLMLDEWAADWGTRRGVRVAALRYSNVYGTGEAHKGRSASMIHQMASTVQFGQRPRLFKWGEQARDFVHVDDVVRANLLALRGVHGVFNVGSGVATTFNRLFEIIKQATNSSLEPDYVDNPIEAVYQSHTLCDLERSSRELGYAPKVSVEAGVSALCRG